MSYLIDNEYHSGSRLAAELGVSRTAVWKRIKQFRRMGLMIESRHAKGYRLQDKIEFLDAARIADELEGFADDSRIEVLFDTDSTSRRLTGRIGRPDFHCSIALAECQHDGRGRRGRTWTSPFARGLYLSLGWHFAAPPASLNALSLASGVAVIQALNQLGLDGIYLKWPNDLICGDEKIGGILLESRSEAATSCDVVIGIGINVHLSDEMKFAIGQPVTDLASHCGRLPSRNQLAGRVIAEQLRMLRAVAAGGMGEYVEKWRQLDCFSGRRAELLLPGQSIRGLVRGVDDNGLLLLETAGRTEKFSSGELSLRAAR